MAVLGIGLGAAPWVAVVLAGTFVAYSAVKKRAALGPIVSVALECLMLAPFALLWLGLEPGALIPADGATLGLLLLTGPSTALPLILYAEGARRLPVCRRRAWRSISTRRCRR